MRAVAVIQARMGSTRLPGKVLEDIAGKTMLERVVERARRIPDLQEVVVAATDDPRDAPIVDVCARIHVPVFRGSVEDVLDRYHRTAEAHRADPVVRLTSDNPLLDPEVGARVLAAYRDQEPDYASNGLEKTYPLGLTVEVVRASALARAWKEATRPYERVHVTPYIYQHPDMFRLVSVRAEENLSDLRWTVDTPEDLAFARAVYDRLGTSGEFGWRDILALLSREPALREINRYVRQKSLEEG